jgi:hypothetical protein
MSTDPSNLTVADRARRTADNIDRIANAASGDHPASLGLDAPSQLVDAINYDMLYVLDWVERRRGADTSAALRTRLVAVVSALDEAPEQTPEGAIILDLFGQARQLAWTLRNWAEDIETEDAPLAGADHQRSDPHAVDSDALTAEQVAVLCALEANYPSTVLQVDLAEMDLKTLAGDSLRLSRRTIGSCLKELRDRGLANRPQGTRKGDAITEAGRKLLAGHRPAH